MAKIDLFDPKWIEMVFAGKNQEYGAYQLRKGTSRRNIVSLLILTAAVFLIGGYLAWKVIEEQRAKELAAYNAQIELSKLEEAAKKERKQEEQKPPPPPQEMKVPEERATQQFTAPEIKKDELVKEENMVKQMQDLDKDVAVGAKDQEGTNDRIVPPTAVEAPPPPPPPAPEAPKEEVKAEVTQKIFDVVEQQPSFPGGQGALLSWLNSNIHYPPVAEENGIQGKVVVSFVVEPDGSISNVAVVRGVDQSLDKEAVRVVKSMPKWNPGKQNGQAVRVKYNLPVTFKLQ